MSVGRACSGSWLCCVSRIDCFNRLVVVVIVVVTNKRSRSNRQGRDCITVLRSMNRKEIYVILRRRAGTGQVQTESAGVCGSGVTCAGLGAGVVRVSGCESG